MIGAAGNGRSARTHPSPERLGLIEATNRLIRAGMTALTSRARYQHATRDLGLKVDVTDIGAVLDLLDED